MIKKFIFAAIFSLVLISSNSYLMSVFAEKNEIKPNNTFIDLNSSDFGQLPCKADAEFRIVQINPNQIDKNTVNFNIKTTSLVVNLTKGVIGQGFVQNPITMNLNDPDKLPYQFNCFEVSEINNFENKTFSIEKDQKLNSIYNFKINDKNFGLVTSDSSYLESDKITKNKSTSFFLVTGADACDAYGAYRMVNVNFKESDNKWISEIDVSSLFFNKTMTNSTNVPSYHIVGSGTVSRTLEGTVEYSNEANSYLVKNSEISLDDEIKLDNDITCKDKNSEITGEKFGINITEDGNANLNLPPIRFKN